MTLTRIRRKHFFTLDHMEGCYLISCYVFQDKISSFVLCQQEMYEVKSLLTDHYIKMYTQQVTIFDTDTKVVF